ncbi:FUSC family protein [Streptomyces sp. NPDC088387]|uniref:FUSC family protein n=1 Tax=Streptomyces sp. NPDC088387 TaxID=3365859 RepID=UPI003810F45A
MSRFVSRFISRFISRFVSSTTPASPTRRTRPLPLSGVLRAGRPSDIWFKPALSGLVAVAPPNLTLVALDRLDLAMYTMAGSLCALYAHNRPYRARAGVLALVVLGMLGGLAVALLTASLTTNALLLVAVGALLAAVQKALCDATRIGPPGNVVLTFVSSAALFAPQTAGRVPGHLALCLAAGAWAWLVGMAPALVRPHGPERRATAQALTAAAAHVEAAAAGDGTHARAAAAAAVQAAWGTVLTAGARSTTRSALELLVVRAEVALAAPADTDPARLRTWARALRGTGPVPVPEGEHTAATRELLGVDVELAAPRPPLRRTITALAPIATRTALGCALAGYASLAVGVGRPYWALVTAAALYQANVTLTWSRGVQRVVGNLGGVLVFAALVPLAHAGRLALVLCCLALNFGAEALMSRNYWLGSLCVTPMALLVVEFPGLKDPGVLMTERATDTVIGALVGFVAAIAVTNRRAGDHLAHALSAAERAREHTARLLAGPRTAPAELAAARRTLAAALADLRATADAASGEWWQRALPYERVVSAERTGHRTLAATVRRQGLSAGPDRGADDTTEDVRP